MKTFNIYKHPTLGFEAVKVGFSWPAFFFGWLWLLSKKLWGFAGAVFGTILLLLAFAALVGASDARDATVVGYLVIAIGSLALVLLPALKGNDWRETNLSKRGYERCASLQAYTPDHAVAQASQNCPNGATT